MHESILVVLYTCALAALCKQIQCHDVHQCANMNSSAPNSYLCFGEQSCINSTLSLEAGNFLYCRGDRSCESVTVVSNGGVDFVKIYSNGKLATKNSNFVFINTSAGDDIYLRGYYSALNTSVICDSSLCGIYCSAYGCYGNNCDSLNSTNCIDTNIVECIDASNISGCLVSKEVSKYTEPLYDGEPFIYHDEYVYQSYFEAYTMFKNRTFACINSSNEQECKENNIIINGQDYDMFLCARGNGCVGSVVIIRMTDFNSIINDTMIDPSNMTRDLRVVCSGMWPQRENISLDLFLFVSVCLCLEILIYCSYCTCTYIVLILYRR